MHAGGDVDKDGGILAAIDSFEATGHAARRLDAAGGMFERHAVPQADAGGDHGIADERHGGRVGGHGHQLATGGQEKRAAEEPALDRPGMHDADSRQPGGEARCRAPRGRKQPVTMAGRQSRDEAALVAERGHDPRDDSPVGPRRGMAVEMRRGKTREGDGIADHAGGRLRGEHPARHLDDRMGATRSRQPRQAGGERRRR